MGHCLWGDGEACLERPRRRVKGVPPLAGEERTAARPEGGDGAVFADAAHEGRQATATSMR